MGMGINIGMWLNVGNAQHGSLLNYEPEYKAVYDAMTVKPCATLAKIQNTFVKTLVNGGVWYKLDFFNFRPIHTNENGEAQLNWINPAQSIALVNSPTYQVFGGFTGNGSNSYINTQVNPSLLTNYSLNDACVFFYKSIVGISSRADLGINDETTIVNMATHVTNDNLEYNRINNINTSILVIEKPSSYTGLWLLNRYVSGSFDIWQNTTKRANKPIASTSIPNGIIWELAINDSYMACSPAEHILFGIGKSLSDAEIVILNNAVSTYLAAIERFDSILNNSINISEETGYNIRNPFSEFEFYTTDTKILVQANPTLYGSFPDYAKIAVFEDDVYKSIYQFDSWKWQEISLSSGYKKVTLVEGLTSTGGGATQLGTYLTGVRAGNFTKNNDGNIATKTVFLVDSIGVGGNADNPQKEAFARLFKIENSKEMAVLGYGYGKLKDFAETTEKINDTVSKLVSLLSNATEKKIAIALGTNDYALDSTAAATFGGWYANLLDAINTEDSGIEVYCISPIRRTNDPSLLADYRTQINTVCSTRTFAIHINGYDILELTDLADGIHPTTAGHKKYKDAIYPVIYPS